MFDVLFNSVLVEHFKIYVIKVTLSPWKQIIWEHLIKNPFLSNTLYWIICRYLLRVSRLFLILNKLFLRQKNVYSYISLYSVWNFYYYELVVPKNIQVCLLESFSTSSIPISNISNYPHGLNTVFNAQFACEKPSHTHTHNAQFSPSSFNDIRIISETEIRTSISPERSVRFESSV